MNKVLTRLPLLAWLVLAWVLLWGRLSAAVVLSGILAAVVVKWLVRLPPLPGGGRLRPLPFLVAVAILFRDLVPSSLIVARQLRHGRTVRSAVLAVPLRVRSDATLTLIAADVTLRPGTVMVDVDRSGPTMFVHGLPAAGDEDIERLREMVYDAQERVVRAFGTAEEVQALREER